MEITKYVGKIGGVITEPRKTFEAMLHEESGMLGGFLIAIFIFAVIGALQGSLFSGFMSSLVEEFDVDMDTSATAIFSFFKTIVPIFSVGSEVVTGILAILIWGLLAHVCAKYIYGGAGKFNEMLSLFGYTMISYILVVIGLIVLTITPIAGIVVIIILGALALAWRVVLNIYIVQEVHGISGGKAFVSVCIIPLVLLPIAIGISLIPMIMISFFVG